jgi:quercetin 2,3-dioxygenase
MSNSFVLRDADRGHEKILSTGPTASYVGGHPDAFITRHSSFNFHDYQSGRPGFGRIRVFGDETFNNPGCSYNMHPHHNFIICAFVLSGRLQHINTTGNNDELLAGDYYAFSAGSGGLHTEINVHPEPMNAIYLWMLPDHLHLPPSYARGRFDTEASANRITPLLGADAPLPIPQDARVSRLYSTKPSRHIYRPRSSRHGVYCFVIDGTLACDGTPLGRRDSKGLWDAAEIMIETGGAPADALLVETIL